MSVAGLISIFETSNRTGTLLAAYLGGSKGIKIYMNTDVFKIAFDGGKASIGIDKDISPADARRLGNALLEAADSEERRAAEWDREQP